LLEIWPAFTTGTLATGTSPVAAAPLFDISQIDLDRVTATTEQVEALNPHRGHMRLLDHVIWMNEDATAGLGVKYIKDDEFWVTGHIPGRPLLPGVLMIEAAAQLCSFLHKSGRFALASQFLGFTRCDKVAFRGQVVPGDALYLLAKEISQRRQRFVSQAQAMVNGRLVFEGEITGMAM
jgi:3-hydroxyacyl-[acyl-carrier-protein] dehydratase